MSSDEQLFERLNNLRGSKTLIVGIGQTLKGDDGVGPSVCQQLRQAKVSVELLDAGTTPENYIQPIIKKAPQNLLIIDAVDFGAPAGTIRLFEPEKLSSLFPSTHTPSPRLFIDIIRKDIEVKVFFVGIQPAHTKLGQPLSPVVTQAVQLLVNYLSKIFPPAESA